jgi:predicted DCC family thiol-disulfide oxidoreductase YuxK
MNNGWTGGQYSLYRALFGVCLAVHFAQMLAHTAGTAMLLPGAGLLLSVLFVLGLQDRWAGLLLGLLSLVIFSHDPRLDEANWLIIAGLLLAHLFLPSAPYGSWTARGRTDPDAGWRMPLAIFAPAWIALALCYGYCGFEAVQTSTSGSGLLLAWSYWLYGWVALAFPLLALIRPVRPWLWLVMFLLQLLILPTEREPLSLGLLLLHGITFDPAWIRPQGVGTEPIFYDGHCGLCHRAVRFVLAEDRDGTAFRFAPLDSDAFRAAVSEEERAKLPDSMVVKTKEGAVLTRSAAFLHILRRLGGLWRVVALIGGLVPQVLRDLVYDGVARVRRRLFASPADACPVLPKELRQRFDY